MNVESSVLSFGERIGVTLCDLYRSCGYGQYKMSKFEEYDLYARNKEFLVSDSVLTFTDVTGKLMALKPDVTLSIVRSSRDGNRGTQKVYYKENVYRVAGSGAFQEIPQAGLECIGEIDDYQICEVVMLAAESLRRISERSVLVLSQMDILTELTERLGVDAASRRRVLECVAGKNLHELRSICAAAGADPAAVERLCTLAETRGEAAAVLPVLERLNCPAAAIDQLRTICRGLAACGLDRLLQIDFSVVSDTNYYNGVVFKGFVEGVPVSVVSGGQYDRLMEKMHRRSGAVGFAVYLDTLERLDETLPEYDTDVVLLYDDGADVGAMCAAVQSLTAEGQQVTALRAVPEKLRYRRLLRLEGSEVRCVEARS